MASVHSQRSADPVAVLAVFVTLIFIGAFAGGGAGVKQALAGPVKGRISGQEKLIPDVYVEASKPEAHRFAWREPSPTVKAEFRNLSGNPSREICVAATEAANAAAHEPILLKSTGGRTIPATIVVSPGT